MKPLNIERINLFAPYKVVVSERGDLLFSTVRGVNYAISFTKEFKLGGCDSYQLGIMNRNNVHGAHDSNVRNTILIIINEFFAVNKEVLLYICDTSDGRQAVRNRLFLKWFQDFAKGGRFTIETANAVVEEETIYAAIIVENTNPYKQEILKDFKETSEMLSSKDNS